MFNRFFFALLIFSSCQSDYSEIKKINRESIFHCNASKIWVVNKVKKKGINFASKLLKDKDLVIFYKKNEVLIQPVHTLGTFPSKTGLFQLSDDNQLCQFQFPKEKWQFKVLKISAEKILLKATSKSDFPYDLDLISYPNSEQLKMD